MSITLRRQLNEDEKNLILKMHGRRDFATGLPIPQEDEVQFDHIQAFAEDGETDLNNIAPMSAETNRAKGTQYREPVEDNMLTESYKRSTEINNVVARLNMLHDLGLHNWNSNASNGDTEQRKLSRMFGSKSMMAWSELLVDAVTAKLNLDDSDDKARPFYRDLTKIQLDSVKVVVSRLFAWKFWSDAHDEIDNAISGNKSAVKQWFKEHGLRTGYLLGASE